MAGCPSGEGTEGGMSRGSIFINIALKVVPVMGKTRTHNDKMYFKLILFIQGGFEGLLIFHTSRNINKNT